MVTRNFKPLQFVTVSFPSSRSRCFNSRYPHLSNQQQTKSPIPRPIQPMARSYPLVPIPIQEAAFERNEVHSTYVHYTCSQIYDLISYFASSGYILTLKNNLISGY